MKLRSFLLSTAILAVAAPAALAADLPSRRAPPVYVPPLVPTFTWTGLYAGVNAGYAFDANSTATTVGNDPFSNLLLAVGAAPSSGRTHATGFTGGGQAGYNYELGGAGFPGLGGAGGGLVVGVEADAAYTDLSGNAGVTLLGITTNLHTRTDYVGTVRGRVGVAFDRVLLYGTGGFAYGEVLANASGAAGGTTFYSGASDRTRGGYSYGGGIEYALPTDTAFNFLGAGAVTIKAEFIHYDLGTSSTVLNGNPAIPVLAGSSLTTSIHTEGNLARMGLNYKFGTPVAVPVVARY